MQKNKSRLHSTPSFLTGNENKFTLFTIENLNIFRVHPLKKASLFPLNINHI